MADQGDHGTGEGNGRDGVHDPGPLAYDAWMDDAMRQVVARAIGYVARHGLPGAHHFFLTFRTDYPGTVVPTRLLAQYPEEMTIVLQHQFWDLKLDTAARLISVGLSFGGVPSTLHIPLDAVTGFADPEVQFGVRLHAREPASAAGASQPAAEPAALPAPAATRAPPPAGETPEEPQVVRLDAFRRRPPKE